MKKEMLINVLQSEETRIAILEDGVLEELYVERNSHESWVGNIYKGRIVNIEPSIQAAFVDFGVGRNGFLHISDVDPQYFNGNVRLADMYGEVRMPRPSSSIDDDDLDGPHDPPDRPIERGEPMERGDLIEHPDESRAVAPRGRDDRSRPTSDDRGDRGRRRRRGRGKEREPGDDAPMDRDDPGFSNFPRSQQPEPTRRPSSEGDLGFGAGLIGDDFQDAPFESFEQDRGNRPIGEPTDSHDADVSSASPRDQRGSRDNKGGDRGGRRPRQESGDRGPRSDRNDRGDRGGRGRTRGRGRGSDRMPPSGYDDIPEPFAVDPDSLPELEDLQLEPTSEADFDPQFKPEPILPNTAFVPEVGEVFQTEVDEEDGFGAGLLGDDEPESRSVPRENDSARDLKSHRDPEDSGPTEEPRIESPDAVNDDPPTPQRGFFRATPKDDDDFGFGDGLFESTESKNQNRQPDDEADRSRQRDDEADHESPSSGPGRETPDFGPLDESYDGETNIGDAGDLMDAGGDMDAGNEMDSAGDLDDGGDSHDSEPDGEGDGEKRGRRRRRRRGRRGRSGRGEGELDASDSDALHQPDENSPPRLSGTGRSVPTDEELLGWGDDGDESEKLPPTPTAAKAPRPTPPRSAERPESPPPRNRDSFDLDDEPEREPSHLFDPAPMEGRPPARGEVRGSSDSDQSIYRSQRRPQRGHDRGGERSERNDRGDKGERTERPDRPERSERSERSPRPERGERMERNAGHEPEDRNDRRDQLEHGEDDLGENMDRTERTERGDRGERDDRLSRGERGPRGDRPERSDRDRNDRGDRGGRSFDRNDRSNNRRSGPRDRDFRPGARPRQRPPIQQVFQRGQEVLVQVIKEGIGNKGPTLSTYVSIPGRYLVVMPGMSRVGVSRKIIDDDQRRRLRDLVVQLDRPEGLGIIIRTAGLERTKRELEKDLTYLVRLWDAVVKRIRGQRSPCPIYQESDMIIRTIRDVFSGDIDAIYIDEKGAYERAKEFFEMVMPKYADRLKYFDRSEPLFHHFGVEDEIAKINQKTVPLAKGGSIVIEQTEALVAIDVNSGNFRADDDAETTAYQMNLQAAKEIARQLRLRDLGGVIVNDFIDMKDERHRRSLEDSLHRAISRDRARTKVLRMSHFGMIEMTRQRIRPSLRRSLYRECPTCRGFGCVKSVESMALESMRVLQWVACRDGVRRIQMVVHSDTAEYIQNHKRREVLDLEERSGIQINIVAKEMKSPEEVEVFCFDSYGDLIDPGVTPPLPAAVVRRR